jgi:hypothetical protein
MRTFLLVLCFAVVAQLQAQDIIITKNPTIRNLSFDLGGSSLLASISYDQRFRGNRGLGFRAGMGMLPISVNAKGSLQFTFPIQMNFLLMGNTTNFYEFGAGVTLFSSPYSGGFISFDKGDLKLLTGYAGYRYQSPRRHGFMFRAGLSILKSETLILPWPGLSFGWRL